MERGLARPSSDQAARLHVLEHHCTLRISDSDRTSQKPDTYLLKERTRDSHLAVFKGFP